MNRREALVAGSRVAAGIALIATLFVRWVDAGPGSTMSGRELAAAFRTLPVFDAWGTTAAIGLYAVAVLGVAALAVSLARSVAADVVLGAVAAVTVAAFVVLATRQSFPVSNWSLGPVLAVAAAATISATSIVQLTAARSAVSPTSAPDPSPSWSTR